MHVPRSPLPLQSQQNPLCGVDNTPGITNLLSNRSGLQDERAQ